MRSIMQDKNGICLLCLYYQHNDAVQYVHEHHIFYGPYRKHSEKCGLKIYLCPEHHEYGNFSAHHNPYVDNLLKKTAEAAFLLSHTKMEYIAVFGKNYLDMDEWNAVLELSQEDRFGSETDTYKTLQIMHTIEDLNKKV